MAALNTSRFRASRHIDVSGVIWHNATVNSIHLSIGRHYFSAFVVLLPTLVFSVCAQNASAQKLPSQPPLMSVRQLREVSPEQAARSFPVRLRGVVTFCDARADLGMFIHDATGGIYVKLGAGTNNFEAGDEVEVVGRSGAGDFVPVVIAERVSVFDHATLPNPDRVTYDQLATGVEDGQWVEVRGTLRAVVPAVQGHTLVEFLVDGQRLSALVTHFDISDADKLIGSVASVRGVCRTRFNNRRQIRAPFLSVTSSDNITVETPAPRDTIEVPLAQLFQFNPGSYYGRRVKVQGVVTEQKGGSLFIQDKGEGLSVKTHETNVFVPGDVVSVVGFAAVGQYSPVLEDAVVRRLVRGAPPAPVNVKPEQLLSEDYDGELVRLRARLMNHVQRGDEQVLVLEAENMILSARVDSARTDRGFGELQLGSELEVTGVCLTQPTENWNPSVVTKPESFQLLLRASNDVTVIRNPPWWTLSRLLWMLGMMSVVLLAGFAWVFVLDRRVRQQTAIIQQKIQREAVLEERTRIAREFHDTLEQELVAITIQLETVADQFDEAPQVARQMLDLARNMARRSLFEARRSVWDLRSHLLENSTLVNAVGEVAKLMSASSRVPILVGTSGSPHKLPAQVENNLLRITQEALANSLKHARATQINVSLAYDPGKVWLRIQDDGVGFDTNNSAIMYAGHFGLLDMSERAEKMGGTFSVTSASGQGTEIIVGYAEKDEPPAVETESVRQVNFPANPKTEIA
jgi:signal transduction histidine kinase